MGVTIVDVDLSDCPGLQSFFQEPKHQFLPEKPKDTEVPIGFWSLDPDPQRLVTAEIQKTGELGFFIRNLTREGKGVKPSVEYNRESDTLIKVEWEDIKDWVDFHSKSKKEGADTSAESLMDYVFTHTRKTRRA